jgi:hypothetical protein
MTHARGSASPRTFRQDAQALVKGLRHQILAQRPVAHAEHDDPEAVIPGCRVELRELALILFHALYTHEEPDSST